MNLSTVAETFGKYRVSILIVAAVPAIKHKYGTGLRAYSSLLADSRGGNKSLKRIPHNPLRSAKAGSAYYTESA